MCQINTLNVLCEQCPGAFLCLIENDRMTCRLAAKAAQEEAGKHAYATYVAMEVMRQRVKSYRQDLQTVQTRSSVHTTSLSEHECLSMESPLPPAIPVWGNIIQPFTNV